VVPIDAEHRGFLGFREARRRRVADNARYHRWAGPDPAPLKRGPQRRTKFGDTRLARPGDHVFKLARNARAGTRRSAGGGFARRSRPWRTVRRRSSPSRPCCTRGGRWLTIARTLPLEYRGPHGPRELPLHDRVPRAPGGPDATRLICHRAKNPSRRSACYVTAITGAISVRGRTPATRIVVLTLAERADLYRQTLIDKQHIAALSGLPDLPGVGRNGQGGQFSLV